MISPEYPAAVIAGNTEVSQCITDALYGARSVLASAQGTMNNFVYANDRYQNYETICGGTGAGPDHDGTSAVHRSEEHTSELQSLMRISYAVFCLKKKKKTIIQHIYNYHPIQNMIYKNPHYS